LPGEPGKEHRRARRHSADKQPGPSLVHDQHGNPTPLKLGQEEFRERPTMKAQPTNLLDHCRQNSGNSRRLEGDDYHRQHEAERQQDMVVFTWTGRAGVCDFGRSFPWIFDVRQVNAPRRKSVPYRSGAGRYHGLQRPPTARQPPVLDFLRVHLRFQEPRTNGGPMPDPGWLLTQLSNPRNIFDILVVAVIIYWLLWFAQGTRATQLIRGIVLLLALAFIFGTTFQLTALNWVLQQTWPVLLISLPVIFQPEIRRALEQLGQTSSWLPQLRPRPGDQAERTVSELVKAATQLARHRYGALIILERKTGLQNFIERGVPIDGLLTRQLLINLFYPNSPLHDGAAVVRDGRIVAASVVLPLTDNTDATSQLGTRHRAAIGITEQSDAVAVVVSEETGQISVAENGRLIRNLDAERLEAQLREFLHLEPSAAERGLLHTFGDLLRPASRSEPNGTNGVRVSKGADAEASRTA
jgi:diadenylate cyclase